MRVMCLEPGGGGAAVSVADRPAARQAADLHELIGGYFESVPMPPELAARGLLGLVDEDGWAHELEPSVYSILFGQSLVGRIVIVRTKGVDFVSLSDADVEAVRAYFGAVLIVRVAPRGAR
jgi:hypothetical protein